MNIFSLDAACEAIRNGDVIVFPTETFFGLGCDAMNPDAVGKIFSVKKRSLNMPLPVVISDIDDLKHLVARVPEGAKMLMDTFWPGPLSIVLPALSEVPDLLTANAGRIAVRFSPHPAVAALQKGSGKMLVASSANISGTPSVGRTEDLDPLLLKNVAGVYLHDPLPAGGNPSTVVDVIQNRDGAVVRILRPGFISADTIRAANFQVEDLDLHECTMRH